MLYLLEDRDYVKIGYSKNVNERLKTHRTSNCYIRLIDTKPGTLRDEKILHKICEPYLYSSEWFHNVPEVKQAFSDYKSEFVDLEWLKTFVTDRYKEFKETGIFPTLSTKDELEVARHNLGRSEFPEIDIWVHCFNDQIKIDKILRFLKTGYDYPTNVNKLIYDIYPNDCYNINKDLAKLCDVLSKELERQEELIREYHALKPLIESHSETLDQNNRYFNLIYIIEDFDPNLIKNRIKFYEQIVTKFSSED